MGLRREQHARMNNNRSRKEQTQLGLLETEANKARLLLRLRLHIENIIIRATVDELHKHTRTHSQVVDTCRKEAPSMQFRKYPSVRYGGIANRCVVFAVLCARACVCQCAAFHSSRQFRLVSDFISVII